MTDKEAYELMVKYAGPQGVKMLTEMIHLVGVKKTVENIIKVWSGEMPEDFKAWMFQGAKYIKARMSKPFN